MLWEYWLQNRILDGDFAKIVNDFWPLNIFAKNFILDIWVSSEYAFALEKKCWPAIASGKFACCVVLVWQICLLRCSGLCIPHTGSSGLSFYFLKHIFFKKPLHIQIHFSFIMLMLSLKKEFLFLEFHGFWFWLPRHIETLSTTSLF